MPVYWQVSAVIRLALEHRNHSHRNRCLPWATSFCCAVLYPCSTLPYSAVLRTPYSCSSTSGEVEDPGNTFPRAMAAAFVVILSGYLLPLIVGTGICIPKTKGKCASWTEWSDGYALCIKVL